MKILKNILFSVVATLVASQITIVVTKHFEWDKVYPILSYIADWQLISFIITCGLSVYTLYVSRKTLQLDQKRKSIGKNPMDQFTCGNENTWVASKDEDS